MAQHYDLVRYQTVPVIPVEEDGVEYIRVNVKWCNGNIINEMINKHPWIKGQMRGCALNIRCLWEWENDDEYDRVYLEGFCGVKVNSKERGLEVLSVEANDDDQMLTVVTALENEC